MQGLTLSYQDAENIEEKTGKRTASFEGRMIIRKNYRGRTLSWHQVGCGSWHILCHFPSSLHVSIGNGFANFLFRIPLSSLLGGEPK
jgi:hypothetical protein